MNFTTMYEFWNQNGRDVLSGSHRFNYDELDDYLRSIEGLEYSMPDKEAYGNHDFVLDLKFLSYHESNPMNSVDASLDSIEDDLRGDLRLKVYTIGEENVDSVSGFEQKNVSIGQAVRLLEPGKYDEGELSISEVSPEEGLSAD